MNYKIPLFDLNFDEEEEKAALETIHSKWISTGPKNVELENKFASMLKVKHAIALTNCTVALHLALEVAGIRDGDEVLVPSMTFVATVNSILYVRATPVFCDIISNENLTIDPIDIERKITPRTKAIVVMHFAGFPCKMKEIMTIAAKYKVKVIEDACHGPLSDYDDTKLGTIGDVGCFSFFSNKNISTGEGGMIVTNNDEYAARIKLLRSHGMTSMSYERAKGHTTSYDVVEIGYNYRMDDIRASIAIVQLNKLEADLEKRMILRKYYLDKLSLIPSIIVPFKDHKKFCSNYIFPIILNFGDHELRDEVRDKLHAKGIQTSIHYPAAHRFSIYKRYNAELPKTDYATDHEITLPIYSGLKFEEIDYIVQSLKEIINE
jgi:dTDP-4-amino-4,6-dideoxygalactose transaminase